ncbi:MAG: peptide chain release factor N(5)-glutamine methyltransferase [Cyanobium sp.]
MSAEVLLAWRRRMLALGGSPSELDWLLELGGGIGWPQLQALHLHPQQPLRLQQPLETLEALWRRHRLSAEPLQYLVGRCPWRDLDLAVAPGVLIPRQETEMLVDLALALLPPSPADPLHWADLGTGSGCLAVALTRALPGSRGFAVDISPLALDQLAANLARCACAPGEHGSGSFFWREQLTLLQSDWWSALKPWWGRLDLVISNPPYIPTPLLGGLDPVVRDHEPMLALDGGPDGLTAIRSIVAGASQALAPGGLLLLEHHHDQSAAVQALLAAAGLQRCRAHQDLEGVWRFASALRAPR